MAEDPSDAFVDFLLRRAGEHLRSVVTYGPTDSEVMYLRDDVAGEYSVRELEASIEAMRRDEAFSVHRQEQYFDHGSLNCTVRVYDRGLEMHFPHGDESGTAVGLDAEAAEHLYTFVSDCLERADDLPRPAEP